MKAIKPVIVSWLTVSMLSFSCAAKEVMQFSLQVDTRTTQAFLKNTTQVSLTLVITLRLLQEDQEGQWWGIKADHVKLAHNYSDTSYELPFAFYLTEKGQISDFWFPNNLHEMHLEKLKGLAYYFQWQYTKQGQKLTEQDNIGTYEVIYTYPENGISKKQKVNYQSTLDYNITILQSNHQRTRAANFFTQSIGVEEISFEHELGVMNLIAWQKYNINERDSLLPSTLLDLPNDLSLWTVGENIDEITVSEIEFHRSMLIKILANQDLASTPSNELALMLSDYAEGLDVIEQIITDGLIDKTSSLRLFNAIAQIDNKNSQILLSNLMINKEINNDVKFLAMRALTKGHAALTEEVANTLLNLLQDEIDIDDIVLKSSVLHGIGTILGRRFPNQLSMNIRDALITKMRNESSDKELATIISSLGNTKDPEFVAELERYKVSSSSYVRSSLAEALGYIKSSQSPAILTEMLKLEVNGSSLVQSSILKSLKHYSIDDNVISMALNYIDKSANEDVRLDAIKLIGNKKISKKDKHILHSLMMKETNRQNFRAIANLLHQ